MSESWKDKIDRELQKFKEGALPGPQCCPLDDDRDGNCPVHEAPNVLRTGTVIHQIVARERENAERAFTVRDEFREKLKNSARPMEWAFCPFCGVHAPEPGNHHEIPGGCRGDHMQRWWAEKKYDHPGKARSDVEQELANDRMIYGTSFEMKTADGERKRLDPRTVIISGMPNQPPLAEIELLAEVVEFLNSGYTNPERFALADKIDDFLSSRESDEDPG